MTLEYDDNVPQLSANALGALQEFLGERDQRAKQFEDLRAAAEADFDTTTATKPEVLARQLLHGATDQTSIAVVSAPSVFIQLKNLLASNEYTICPHIVLLEFDQRFEVFKEFVPYDFEYRDRLPPSLKGQFDRIICDPPFLSVDCQTKAALAVRWLSRSWTSSPGLRLIVCTGERMEELISKLYGKPGVRTTTFEVQHAKGLSNEFRCYSNFECDPWQWGTVPAESERTDSRME
ncbi:hypothetical protein K490DRAFT_67733 [Saccharata proteae CBS 121410]|uniref:Elongation factor methyltransferase 5 n=1 Tax=Saccharata proteae CBS 121410 TaxID=1314787 RepID=A0A9P4HP67_9PEZI|nr:hypothetical protein K490DRAFT_67733 [Saccharata proteae CBS 121410]